MKEFTITQENTTFTLTLKELSQRCGIPADRILELVEFGVLDAERVQPTTSVPEHHFDAASLFKVKRLLRLQNDLHLNMEGAALAVDLLDEIDRLRNRVRELESMVDRLTGW